MITKIKNSIVAFVLVVLIVAGLVSPTSMEAVAKTKIIRKTTTITFVNKDSDGSGKTIDLRKSLGKFKNYVTTNEEYIKLTVNAYEQELYLLKPGVYFAQVLEGDKLRKSFKLIAKKGKQKLILTVKIKDKRKRSDESIEAEKATDAEAELAKVLDRINEEWLPKCLDDIRDIIADENTMAEYLKKKKNRVFVDNVPFETKQICCIELWLRHRMHYNKSHDSDGHSTDAGRIYKDYGCTITDSHGCVNCTVFDDFNRTTYKDLYEGNYYGICSQGAHTEFVILLSLGFKPYYISSKKLHHAWCVVKTENCAGYWWARGIYTETSFAPSFPWRLLDDPAVFDGGQFLTVIDMHHYEEGGETHSFSHKPTYEVFSKKIKH